ncbi:MAG: hypothetical protein KKB90_09435 [Actinobacteria bacterium]|nr:hypothetical protein [Actinomycetota bacterium]MCG2818061.1 hypothetical protein [Actinomycetes bacterium]MBU4219164.1 hypothetical protein [Actinomycetota bacterium]MBU4357652.1 hypothetical protein [Actinomycetota bacterium]MBU4403862.1 hypothetical protein [Actinomycetota bacterium]
MERSVGEHAANTNQPCLKGANRGNMSALEKVCEEYRLRPFQLLVSIHLEVDRVPESVALFSEETMGAL